MADTASFTRCRMEPGTLHYDACHAAETARIAELEATVLRLRAELAALQRLDGPRCDVSRTADTDILPSA